MKHFMMLFCLTMSAILTAILMSCDLLDNKKDENDREVPGQVTPGADYQMTMTYTTNGDILITYSDDTVYCYTYCQNTTLIEDCDTAYAGYDTTSFEMAGNTLEIMMYTDTINNAIVGYWVVFTRVGGGSGLQGTWRSTSYTYSVFSGSLTALEQSEINADIAEQNAGLDEEWMELRVVANTVTMYMYEDYIWSEEMIYQMGQVLDTAVFDVTIVAVSANVVKITGNITGEEVTITYNELNGTTTYTSTDQNHSTYIYYDEPTTCPNSSMPTWVNEFLAENMKGQMTKRAAVTLSVPDEPEIIRLFGRILRK